MQTHKCDSTTPIKNGHPIYNGNTHSNICSGYGAQQCSGCWQIKAANFNFSVESMDTALKAGVSIWVGVGGANGTQLVQAGVAQDSTNYNNSYHAFYEYVPSAGGGAGEQDVFSVSSGDAMYFYANFDGQTYLDDYTKGDYYNEIDGSSIGDSAEMIIERNEGCHAPWGCIQLGDFHHYYPYGAQLETTDNTWHDLDSGVESFWGWQLYNQINPDGHLLTTTSGYGDNGAGSAWTETFDTGS